MKWKTRFDNGKSLNYMAFWWDMRSVVTRGIISFLTDMFYMMYRSDGRPALITLQWVWPIFFLFCFCCNNWMGSQLWLCAKGKSRVLFDVKIWWETTLIVLQGDRHYSYETSRTVATCRTWYMIWGWETPFPLPWNKILKENVNMPLSELLVVLKPLQSRVYAWTLDMWAVLYI